ncbi:carboxypeptidase regulatory-like domain-containing protein [Polaribacter sp. PL03]|uniref:carboxypeptidase regulatory-like domain-containing protein n=1 Tax=Polaribacter sp. PL03 TaxID=3088353 RepID=UPI0029D0F566|nr:carboxypeptidase regulatory-like domain-containing protein [Polaribacter sp. PL03]MDX6747626.1 carboxypeptidase regulatory-like domain-containing protein [Polaribacter sp. PL03]
MKYIYKILMLLALSLSISCSEDTVSVVGLGNLTGRVVEGSSFIPLENAKITLSPSNNTVFSDVDGYFKIEDIEMGDYSVSAIKEGYLTNFQPATITTGLDVNVIFEMDDDTFLNKAPSTPVLITPTDGSEEQALSLELIWSSKDAELDIITYRLEIKNSSNNDVIKVASLIDTSYVVSNLKYGTKYFWQIAATDSINNEVLSVVSSFKTKVNPENRYLFVKKFSNGNNGIYSSSYNDVTSKSENIVKLTSLDVNSWRPRKNKVSGLIAFLRTSNNETHLYTMNQDGSNVFKVSSGVPVAGFNLNEIDFSWSANGEKIIYPSYNKLYSINKDGSGLQKIFETSDGSFITECDWSNDGSVIALKTNNVTGYNASIYTINMAGTILKTVLTGVKGAVGGLNISTDNKLLLYSYDVSEFETTDNRQLDTHIFVYNFASDTTNDLSVDKEAGTLDLDPRFSPNESEIIFVNTSNDGLSLKYIYKVDLEFVASVDVRDLLFSDAIMPDWE